MIILILIVHLSLPFSAVSCRLTLDLDTAHPTLFVLDDPQGAHCGEELQSYPPRPQRFDSVAQVLCREGQFGGASYWEVEWRGGGWVDIGVTYRGIGRKGGGKPCLLGRNENSWRLRCTNTGYAAWHDNRKTTVAAPPCPRIGVFLERQKGALSFYSVSETVVLLHTFSCPFSQPLYPAFRLDLDSTLLICPHEGGNGNPTWLCPLSFPGPCIYLLQGRAFHSASWRLLVWTHYQKRHSQSTNLSFTNILHSSPPVSMSAVKSSIRGIFPNRSQIHTKSIMQKILISVWICLCFTFFVLLGLEGTFL